MENWFGYERPVAIHCRCRDVEEIVYFKVERQDGREYSTENWFNGCEQMSGCPQCASCKKEAYQLLLSGSR